MANQPASRLLRIPLQKKRKDDEDFALVHISSNGNEPLDLALIATENNKGFSTKIRHDRIDQLRHNSSKSEDESLWTAILRSVLLGEHAAKEHVKIVDNLDLLATVEETGNLVVAFKHNISGITQRLGSIAFKEDSEADPNLFEWAGDQASANRALTKRLQELQIRYDVQEDVIRRLNTQLDGFIATKEKQETEMLDQFRQLLNNKKLKIRDQQRLLSQANVDSETKPRETGSKANLGQRVPAKSRKRKARAPQHEISSEDEEIVAGTSPDDSDTKDGTIPVPTPDRSDTDSPPATPNAKTSGSRALPLLQSQSRGSKATPIDDGSETDDEL